MLAIPPLGLASPSLRVQRRRERERGRGRRRREMESCLITLLSLIVHRLDLLTPWESQCWNRYTKNMRHKNNRSLMLYYYLGLIIV